MFLAMEQGESCPFLSQEGQRVMTVSQALALCSDRSPRTHTTVSSRLANPLGHLATTVSCKNLLSCDSGAQGPPGSRLYL